MNGDDINVFGVINKIRSYIHIKELVNFIKFLSKEEFTEYTITTYNYIEEMSILDIAKFISQKIKKKCNIIENKVNGDLNDVRTMSFSHPRYIPIFDNLYKALEFYIKIL